MSAYSTVHTFPDDTLQRYVALEMAQAERHSGRRLNLVPWDLATIDPQSVLLRSAEDYIFVDNAGPAFYQAYLAMQLLMQLTALDPTAVEVNGPLPVDQSDSVTAWHFLRLQELGEFEGLAGVVPGVLSGCLDLLSQVRTVNREARPVRCYHCLDEDILRDLHRVVLDILWQTKLLATAGAQGRRLREQIQAALTGRFDQCAFALSRLSTDLGCTHHA